jgi:hypothetical protein
MLNTFGWVFSGEAWAVGLINFHSPLGFLYSLPGIYASVVCSDITSFCLVRFLKLSNSEGGDYQSLALFHMPHFQKAKPFQSHSGLRHSFSRKNPSVVGTRSFE